MNYSYKVTLAIPVYNVQKYIKQALLSALNQTFESVEYLIIDDKGQDDSMNIIRQIIAEHSRGKDVRIIDHCVNQGLGATRNTAIKEAKGENLFFMDSDDEITPECIQFLYDKIHEENFDWVMGSYSLITTPSSYSTDFLCKDHVYNGLYCLIDSLLKGYFVPITTWNKLYRIDFLRQNNIKCIPNHLNEDAWFFFQVMLLTQKCLLTSKITYYYYKIESSITDFHSYTEEKKQRITSQYIEIDRLKKKMLQQFVSDDIYPLLLCVTMRESLRFAYEVSCLNIPGTDMSIFSKILLRYRSRSSRNAIRYFMSYPVDVKTVLKMRKRKKENITYWLASFLPYFFQYIFIVIVRFTRK